MSHAHYILLCGYTCVIFLALAIGLWRDSIFGRACSIQADMDRITDVWTVEIHWSKA